MIETQESIGRWANATFPGGNPDNPREAIRLLEEVVELCLAMGSSPSEIVKYVTKSFGGRGWFEQRPESPAGIAGEMADCAIALDALAHRRGVDLRAEVDAKMVVNRARQWRANGDGTGYHIKKVSR